VEERKSGNIDEWDGMERVSFLAYYINAWNVWAMKNRIGLPFVL